MPLPPVPAHQPLLAHKSVLLLVDYQPRMYYGVEGADRTLIFNNALALAKAARILDVPTVLTSIGEEGNGPFTPEIAEQFPDSPVIERSVPGFDAFLDGEVLRAVKAADRRQLVVSGLWTSMCFSFTALHGLREGFDVFGVMDAAGSESAVAHETGVARMTQAGIVPCTWFQVACEWMATWENPKAPELIEQVYRVHNGFFAQKPSHAPRPHHGVAAAPARR
jgi:nicotinamidase-related amidase